jgi:restriction endonuclease Mrr
MPESLSPHFIDLIRDALLKSFWRRGALVQFMRRMHIAEKTLATFQKDESKRMWLDRVFPVLEAHPKGPAVLRKMADALADQASFPDLANWEDSAQKIESAQAAVAALKAYMEQKKKEVAEERDAAERRKAGTEAQRAVQRSLTELDTLRGRLEQLHARLGTQDAGYDFQRWFYDLMDHFEVDNRRPYTSDGRQIDGSVTIDGTTYLVETKFTTDQSGAPDIDSLMAKVTSKADNTMGIMVSVSGYSSVAKDEASRAKSPLLLIDGTHLYHVLMGIMAFDAMVGRIRRHSAQEGKAYLPVNQFGG